MKTVIAFMVLGFLWAQGNASDSSRNCNITTAGRNYERIAVATSGGKLTVFDRNGKEQWRRDIETDDALRPPLQKSLDGRIIVTGFHTLTAFDAMTGREKWVNTEIDSQITSITATDDGFLCFLEKRITILIDLDGHTLWRTVTGVGHRPAVAMTKTQIVVTGPGGEIICMSFANGKANWTVKDCGQWPRAIFAIPNSRYLVVSSAGLLTTIDADGALVSQRQMLERQRVDFHHIIRLGVETFLAQNSDGMLYWFDANAQVLHQLQYQRPGRLRPISTGRGRIAVISPGFEVAWIDAEARLLGTTRIPRQGSAATGLDEDWIAIADAFGIYFFGWTGIAQHTGNQSPKLKCD